MADILMFGTISQAKDAMLALRDAKLLQDISTRKVSGNPASSKLQAEADAMKRCARARLAEAGLEPDRFWS